jgi:hypothetical protein
MNTLKLIAYIVFCLWLAGCASTKVETSGIPSPPIHLCQASGEQISGLILWGTEWRPDQKEVPLREIAAQRGIEQFFAQSGCFSMVRIRRLSGECSAATCSDLELLKLAASETPGPDRVIFIRVKELGPVLRIGLPILVEGGTEVVLELKAFNAQTNELTAALRTHWQNGGVFVIKGVSTLEHDMSAALNATLNASTE